MTRVTPARPALLRTLNDRTVLDLLLLHGSASRADLARLSGLSKPTITEVLSRLERSALIVDAGETVGRRGPNGRLYDLAVDLVHGAAVTVEPTRITCEVVDMRGNVLAAGARRRSDLPRGAAAALHRVVSQVAGDAAIDPATLHEVVVGVPGSYDATTDQVRYADRMADWTVPGLVASLRVPFGEDVQVTVDNDVNLALVAERDSGAASSAAVSSLLWLANGIGLATDLGGTLYRGESGGAGEIGYIPVPAPAGRGRGAHADFQDLVGGAAVLRLARERGIKARTAAGAVERAVATLDSDPAAAATIDELARRIALGLAVIVAVLDPGLVVLGGAVGRAGGDALASRTTTALRGVSPLSCRVAASTVTGDPSMAGARAVAASLTRDRVLDAANQSALGDQIARDALPANGLTSSSSSIQHQSRTAEEVH